MAVLGFCCCPGFSLISLHGLSLCSGFSCCREQASVVVAHRLGSCSSRALQEPQQLWCTSLVARATKNQQLWCRSLVAPARWDPPRLRIELTSPVLAGRFFTTKPPAKPLDRCFWYALWTIKFCLVPVTETVFKLQQVSQR